MQVKIIIIIKNIEIMKGWVHLNSLRLAFMFYIRYNELMSFRAVLCIANQNMSLLVCHTSKMVYI